MALFRCGAGTGLKETVLWTNPSPNSNFTGGQILTLSETMENFDYLKFVFKISTSLSDECSALYKVADVRNMAGNNSNRGALLSRTTQNYVRSIGYESNTSVSISTAAAMNAASTDDSTVIPLYIYGVKN